MPSGAKCEVAECLEGLGEEGPQGHRTRTCHKCWGGREWP